MSTAAKTFFHTSTTFSATLCLIETAFMLFIYAFAKEMGEVTFIVMMISYSYIATCLYGMTHNQHDRISTLSIIAITSSIGMVGGIEAILLASNTRAMWGAGAGMLLGTYITILCLRKIRSRLILQ